jgi:hypothetical protein
MTETRPVALNARIQNAEIRMEIAELQVLITESPEAHR